MKRIALPVVVLVAAFLFAAAGAAPLFAQQPKASELQATVPALDEMHEVIMPLWHDAWPAKDVKAMAEMWPSIEKHLNALGKATLPGILRDKQTAWDENLAKLQSIGASYKAAVDSGNNDALLKQAEALHAQYEALVRAIRPALPEVDDFHATLYVLYHYQMNPLQLDKAAASIDTLKAKMVKLNAAQLPDRLKAKTAAFEAQRARLSKAVDALVALIPGRDDVRITQAVELMHIEYEKLDRVF